MSTTTSVPSSAGTLATVWSSVRPSARFQLSDGACWYAAHTWYGNSRARTTSSGSVIFSMTASIAASPMPAWSKLRRLRTSAIAPIDGMTASHASASMPPGSQPDSRSHEMPASASAAGAALPQHAPAARRPASASSAAAAASIGSTDGIGDGVVVVPTVQQLLEQRRLRARRAATGA